MKIAIIGAGKVGRTLGRRWAEVGHEVMFGVRNHHDEKTKKLLSEMLGHAAAGSNEMSAQWAEIIVLTTPWNATEQAIKQCRDLTGKIVLDCTNPVKLGATDEMLELGYDTSAGEMVAKWAKGAAVFKSLNQVGWEVMADPVLEDRKAAMFFAGPDGPGRQTVSDLIADLGFEVFHIGDITLSRLLEPLGMTWIHTAFTMGMGRDWAFSVVRRSSEAGS